jgi:cytochrome c peroxidase
MGAGPATLAALMANDPNLSSRYRMLDPNPDPGRLRIDIAKALAAYLETLESPRTRFDTLRDALARGESGATADYPGDALRGLQLFVGRGRCNLCHVGPAFSNGEFHDVGRPFMVDAGRPDPGRHAGVKAVLADPYNRLGQYIDPPALSTAVDDPAVRTRHLAAAHRNFGEFRVPGLRAALLTAPYGHDGSLPALADVVRHYSQIDLERLHADGESLLRPLHLDAQQSADLIAFLRTLSEPERQP